MSNEITTPTELQAYIKTILEWIGPKLVFGQRYYQQPGKRSLQIVTRNGYFDQDSLEMDCSTFITMITQCFNDQIVFAANAGPFTFMPIGHNYPVAHYLGPKDDVLFDALQKCKTCLKGQQLWGPWPDKTYVGFCEDSKVYWRTREEWIEATDEKYRMWLDDSVDDHDTADREKLRALYAKVSEIETDTWELFRYGGNTKKAISAQSKFKCRCDNCSI